jgi:hypothetical protein
VLRRHRPEREREEVTEGRTNYTIRNFIICKLHKILDDKMNNNDIGVVTQLARMENTYKMLAAKPERKEHRFLS